MLLSLQAPILATTLKEIDEALRGHGGMVSSYLPEDSVLVVGRQKALQQITAFGNILGVGEFLPEHKVAPEWITVLEGLSAGGVGMAGLTDWTFEARSNGTWPGRSHLLGAVQTDQGQDGSVRFLVEVSFPSAMFNNKSRSPRQFEPRRMRGQEKGRDDPAGAAVRDWPHLLAEACGSSHRRLSLSADGTHQLVAWVPAEHLRQALAWLSTQPAVHWVAPRAQARLSNYFETSILQGAAARGPAADGHPLWAAGLDGRGQIIGCGDSGIGASCGSFHVPASSDGPLTACFACRCGQLLLPRPQSPLRS